MEGLKARLQELETQGLEGDEVARERREVEDQTMLVSRLILVGMFVGMIADARRHRLKLKVYRSLGIDAECDDAGNYNKAVIRNNQKGDVHVVNIDPKFSRFFYANYFWQTL